jgi:fibro-slime domain-containing protein
MPTIGDKRTLHCTARDLGISKSESDTPSEYQEPPNGEWWGPAHPDFGTAIGKKHATGMVQPTLGKDDRKPIYKTGLTSVYKFLNWFNTDTRPINKAAKTPINIEVPVDLELTWTAGQGWVYDAGGGGFFILDKKGFHKGSSSTFHNYHFTVECQTRFVYKGGEQFDFSGNDDTWVYIDGKLVIDLGGLHKSMSGSIKLDTLTDLVKGNSYDLSLFYAERHMKDATFKIVTNLLAPKTHEVCTRAATLYPNVVFQPMRGLTQFPTGDANAAPPIPPHMYMTRTTCGGNVYKTAAIHASGPSFSPGCASVSSAEQVYALNSLKGGSVSPIAQEKQVLIFTVVDDIGDVYVIMQGGKMPSGTTNNVFVVDVGVDVGTSSTAATSNTLKMFHSPGAGSSNAADWDPTQIQGEYQRMAMSWGSGGASQTAGAIVGPLAKVGFCLRVKVIENGKVEEVAVGSMDSQTGQVQASPVDSLSLKSSGVVVCAHDCNDPCTAEDHNTCDACHADDQCGWSFEAGCFDLTSGIRDLSTKGSCIDPLAPAPRVGPDGQVGYGPANMFNTPSASGTNGGGGGSGGLMGLDPGLVAIIGLVLVCASCCCLGIFYYWCCHSSESSKKKIIIIRKNRL